MTLTKDRIVELIKSKSQFSNHNVKDLVEKILESIKGKLEIGEEVKISGFGKWTVRSKRSRPGRNPHTGQKIQITARKVVTFHPSEKLRARVDKSNLNESQLAKANSEKDDY